MSKTFLFQAIQFSQTIQFSKSMPLVLFKPSIGPLSGATSLGQRRPGSNDNEGVLRILQSPGITGTSPSDCLVSYRGHILGGGVVLPLCREAVGVFYSPSRLGKRLNGDDTMKSSLCVAYITELIYFPPQNNSKYSH